MDIRFALILTLSLVFSGAPCLAEEQIDVTKSVKDILAEINARYDDFFRYQNYLAERMERLQQGVHDRQKKEAEHQAEVEKARLAFVQTRKERPSDEHLRIQWEAEQKARTEQTELLRRRYVEKRDYFEDYTKKGRQIPEMKEFGLDE